MKINGVTLNSIYLMENLKNNLVSNIQLGEHGYNALFTKNECKIKNRISKEFIL